jgi:hypothetical protein
MHSLGASSLAAVSITNEIEIRIRGLRYPNNHSEYSSPFPIKPQKKTQYPAFSLFNLKNLSSPHRRSIFQI